MTGKHYKDLRERAGLTRLELAERLQIGERTVYRIEASDKVSVRDALSIRGVIAEIDTKKSK